jgi:hypothetical protein
VSILPGIYASQITGHLNTTAYESIATQTLGIGGATSITFSSIPSTYKHLQVRISARNTLALANMRMQFNSDTSTSSYRWHFLYGDGTSAGAGDGGTGTGNSDSIYLGNAPTTTSIFASAIVDILDYTNVNKNKTTRALHGYDLNGSGVVQLLSGLWMNSSTAVSSITIFAGTNLFSQYSSFALFGVKG